MRCRRSRLFPRCRPRGGRGARIRCARTCGVASNRRARAESAQSRRFAHGACANPCPRGRRRETRVVARSGDPRAPALLAGRRRRHALLLVRVAPVPAVAAVGLAVVGVGAARLARRCHARAVEVVAAVLERGAVGARGAVVRGALRLVGEAPVDERAGRGAERGAGLVRGARHRRRASVGTEQIVRELGAYAARAVGALHARRALGAGRPGVLGSAHVGGTGIDYRGAPVVRPRRTAEVDVGATGREHPAACEHRERDARGEGDAHAAAGLHGEARRARTRAACGLSGARRGNDRPTRAAAARSPAARSDSTRSTSASSTSAPRESATRSRRAARSGPRRVAVGERASRASSADTCSPSAGIAGPACFRPRSRRRGDGRRFRDRERAPT